MESYKIEKMIDAVLKANIKEVPYEGTQVNKSDLKQGILNLIKDLTTTIKINDEVEVKEVINGIPVGTVGTVIEIKEGGNYKVSNFKMFNGFQFVPLEGVGTMAVHYDRFEIRKCD